MKTEKDKPLSEKDIDARIEEMLLYQVLEEHIEKDKKEFEPCTECIKLGINKGYKLALKHRAEAVEKLKKFKSRNNETGEYDYYLIPIGEFDKILGDFKQEKEKEDIKSKKSRDKVLHRK